MCIDFILIKTSSLSVCSVLSDIKSLHVIYEYYLSTHQLKQQMVGEYLMFFNLHTVNLLLYKINSTVVKYRSRKILCHITTVIW